MSACECVQIQKQSRQFQLADTHEPWVQYFPQNLVLLILRWSIQYSINKLELWIYKPSNSIVFNLCSSGDLGTV